MTDHQASQREAYPVIHDDGYEAVYLVAKKEFEADRNQDIGNHAQDECCHGIKVA